MQELIGNTFGFLHRSTLAGSFEALAAAGFSKTEIVVSEPQFDLLRASVADMNQVRQQAASAGISIASINPGGLDMVSANSHVRDISVRSYLRGIEFAAAVGAETLVVVPGRRSPLSPMPLDRARAIFDEALQPILARADELGIKVALETCPFNFLSSVGELRDVLKQHQNPRLKIAIDVANVYCAGLNVEAEIEAAKGVLGIVHLSDTRLTKWSHSGLGDGELDFSNIARGLTRIGFTGVSSYELADGADPMARLPKDLEAFRALGFAPRGETPQAQA